MKRFRASSLVLALVAWCGCPLSLVAGLVTVTQQAPEESLAPDGSVSGVSEATVGAQYSLVAADGGELILQDAQGRRYRISATATDYTPPPAQTTAARDAAPPKTTPALNATPPHAPSSAPAAASAPSTSAAPPPDFGPTPDGQIGGVAIDERTDDNLMAVWPQGGIAGRPLLIVAHGHGGSGPHEIGGWVGLARSHRFTVVCPTFQSAVSTQFLGSDQPYFESCLRWIEDNLQYDKANVYMTGFSGGGFAVWYLATQRADFIRGLFLQSGNFAGNFYGLDLDRWYDRPVEVIWGSNDLSDIIPQGQAALDALEAADCHQVKHVVVAGAGHQEHPDMVVTWMEQAANPPSSGGSP